MQKKSGFPVKTIKVIKLGIFNRETNNFNKNDTKVTLKMILYNVVFDQGKKQRTVVRFKGKTPF